MAEIKKIANKYKDYEVKPVDELEIKAIQEKRNQEIRSGLRNGIYFTWYEAKEEYFTKKNNEGLNKWIG
jgi:hypothetical protein